MQVHKDLYEINVTILKNYEFDNSLKQLLVYIKKHTLKIVEYSKKQSILSV